LLIGGLILGFAFGLVAGGRVANFGHVRFHWVWLIVGAVALRYLTEEAIRIGIAPAEALRMPLYALAFGALTAGLWLNRQMPGLLVAAIGVLVNGVAVTVNAGWMPVWGPSLQLVGLSQSDLVVSFHRLLPETLGLPFLLQAGPIGDLLPIPLPYLANVASLGDAFIAVGLGWFVFATLVQPVPATETGTIGSTGRLGRRTPEASGEAGGGLQVFTHPTPSGGVVRPATGLAVAGTSAQVGALERPLILGGAAGGVRTGDAAEAVAGAGLAAEAAGLEPAGAIARPATVAGRVAAHPYVRLALDARFSALWLGQLVSLIGDRINQIALAVLVLSATGSPLAVGLTFLAATLPNLLFGPFAGTFVDRWNQKRVLVVSDLLRGGLVLLIPAAASRQIYLVYPLVFGVTTVSIFFRPARAAVLPRLVDRDDLNPANGALWTAETIADLVGYPLAGAFVAFLGTSIAIAFWLDSASYVVSALLIASILIPPLAKRVGPAVGSTVRAVLRETTDGWSFLRHQPTLFANTLISVVGQLTLGATIALTIVYAHDVLDGRYIDYPQNYAAIDTAFGFGSLIGGIVIGALGVRRRKGPLIIGGYLAMGLAVAAMGATDNVLAALAFATVASVANMAFVIPTQTLFQELTPPDMLGRAIGIRFSLIYGALTAAMAISGVAADRIGAGTVLIGFGLLTGVAGVTGAFIPAVRDS